MSTLLYKKIYPSSSRINYDLLSFRIKNVNFTIKKNPPPLGELDNIWLLLRIENVNLIIYKNSLLLRLDGLWFSIIEN